MLRCPLGTYNAPSTDVFSIRAGVWVFADTEAEFISGTGGQSANHAVMGIRDNGKLFGGRISGSDYAGQSGGADFICWNKIGISTQGASTGANITISGVGFQKCTNSFVFVFDNHRDVLIENCYTYGTQVGISVDVDGNGLVTDWNATEDLAARASGDQVYCLTNFYNSGVNTRNVEIRGQKIRNISDSFVGINSGSTLHKVYGNTCLKETDGFYGGFGLDFNGCSNCQGFGNTFTGFSFGAFFSRIWRKKQCIRESLHMLWRVIFQ